MKNFLSHFAVCTSIFVRGKGQFGEWFSEWFSEWFRESHYVGFQHILNCYRHLVPIYGEGEVWCNFVAGLVPLEDIKAGFSFMAAMGVVPGANIYHPEVGSVLGRSIPSPDEEFIRSLYCHAGELYHKYGFKPYFDASVLRNSLANEAYEGLLD